MKKQVEKSRASQVKIREELDKKSTKAIQWFSNMNLSKFNKETVWRSIADKLENMDKKILAWFMAMTTTFTLLVAAGLEYASYHELVAPNPTKSIGKELSSNSIIQSPQVLNNFSSIPKIIVHKKTVVQFKKPFYEKKIIVPETVLPADKISRQNLLKEPKNKKLSISGEVKYLRNQVVPRIGFDFKLFTVNKVRGTHSISLNLSTQYEQIAQKKEPNQSNSHLLTYVGLGYTFSNPHDKGWSVGAGYLTNPDSNVYKKNTIKMSIHRKISKRLRVGSEVIFTNNFQKAYPAISLIVSS